MLNYRWRIAHDSRTIDFPPENSRPSLSKIGFLCQPTSNGKVNSTAVAGLNFELSAIFGYVTVVKTRQVLKA